MIPEVVLAAGGSRSVILELKVPGISEVVAVGARAAAPDAAPSIIDVAPIVVKSVAGAGENIFHVLQTLPGVAAVNDFDSRLSVRGGGPDQNLTMMDGVEIHNPYRLFGLTSAFNPETVANFELVTGGFNAQYRRSPVVNPDRRQPPRQHRHVDRRRRPPCRMTDANIVAEGRLPGNGNSWLVTGRRTYYDLVAERIVDADLPSFADLQARADIQVRPGHRLTLSALSSRESTDARFDDVEEDDSVSDEFVDVLTSTQNDLGALTYSAAIGARAFSKTTVSWYRNRELIDFAGDVRTGARRSNRPEYDAEPLTQLASARQLSIRDAAVRQQFGLNAGTSHLLEAGFETHNLDTTWQWRTSGELDGPNGSSAQGGSSLPSALDSARSSMRAGAWLTDRWTLSPRVRLEPGLRLDWSGVSGETIASPRLAAMFDVTERTRVRVAGGMFTQSPGYEKLLQSDYFVDLTDNGGLPIRSERAWQVLAAVERRLDTGVTMRVEGYYKDFDRLVLGRLETPARSGRARRHLRLPGGIGVRHSDGAASDDHAGEHRHGPRLRRRVLRREARDIRQHATERLGILHARPRRDHGLRRHVRGRLRSPPCPERGFVVSIEPADRDRHHVPRAVGISAHAGPGGAARIDRGSGRGRRGHHTSGTAIRQPRTAGVVGRLRRYVELQYRAPAVLRAPRRARDVPAALGK